MNTLRDGTPFKEVIEVKRVYQHPNYQYPKLYDDIAVVELGRRIPYDYEKVSIWLLISIRSDHDYRSTGTVPPVWTRTPGVMSTMESLPQFRDTARQSLELLELCWRPM